MATPLKQWELNARTPQRSSTASGTATSTTSTSTTSNASPPALPPRPANSYPTYSPSYGPGFGAYGGYGSSYGTGYGSVYGTGYGSAYGTGYGSQGYRPYGGLYGGGGGFGLGYGGMQGEENPQFIRQAEETTRAAFSSVESVVGAVSSVSMMLESTYFAVHSCFRAVLGVAQHFTRLKNHVWGILAAIAVLRRLKHWLRYLLRLLRLRRYSDGEDTWDEVSLQQESSLRLAQVGQTPPVGNSRVWPAVMFFAIVFGVPWLLWKLLTFIVQHKDTTQPSQGPSQEDLWSGDNSGQPLVAKALFDFTATNGDELSFAAGDELVLAPRRLQNGGEWLLAGRNRRSGLIPRNYIQVVHPNSSPGPEQTSRQQLLQEQDLLND